MPMQRKPHTKLLTGHAQHPPLFVLQVRADLVLEEPGLLAIEDTAHRVAAAAGVGGVPRLRDEVALDIVEQAVVVVLDFA